MTKLWSSDLPRFVFSGGHSVQGAEIKLDGCQICGEPPDVFIKTKDRDFGCIRVQSYGCGAILVERSEPADNPSDPNWNSNFGTFVLETCAWAHRKYLERAEKA